MLPFAKKIEQIDNSQLKICSLNLEMIQNSPLTRTGKQDLLIQEQQI